jgi:hypothetical protein
LSCRDDFLEGLQPFEFRFGTGHAGYRCVRATDSRGEDRSGAKLPFRTEGRVFPIAGDGQRRGFAGVPSIFSIEILRGQNPIVETAPRMSHSRPAARNSVA